MRDTAISATRGLKQCLACCLTAVLGSPLALALENRLANGGFEAWNSPPTAPTGWTALGGPGIHQAEGMDGAGFSVELFNRDESTGAGLSQTLAPKVEGALVFSVDFAFEAVPTGGDRSFNLTLRDDGTIRINVRVDPNGDLQFFDRNSGLQGGGGTATWQTVVAGLQASDFALGNVRPYRLEIQANLTTDTMSVTLTDLDTALPVAVEVDASDKWDVPARGAPGAGINSVILAVGRSQAAYRADNVSMVRLTPLAVSAGPDLTVALQAGSIRLSGTVADDGLPDPPGAVRTLWSVDSRPAGANINFADATALSTTVTFDTLGSYILRLTACDDGAPGTCGGQEVFDTMTLRVVPKVPPYSIRLEPVPGPDMSANNQAAWWSPLALDSSGSLYLAYLADNSPQDDVIVARRTPLGSWSWADTGVDARYDAGHTQASIGIDGDGFIHVAYNMHNNPMYCIRSREPGKLGSGFVSQNGQFPPAGRYTYPHFATTEQGNLYLIIRDRQTAHLDRTGWFFRYDLRSQTWLDLGPFAGQPNTTVYPDQVFSPADGTLRIIWEWAAGGAQGSRHLGSYMAYDLATGRFSRADGSVYGPQDIPVSTSTADIYQPLEGSEQFLSGVHGVQSAKMAVDPAGRPVIAYAYSTTGTSTGYEHRLALWDGQRWMRQTLSQGGMSLEKPWVSVHGDTIRYYTALSPGPGDLYLLVSSDNGQTWSPPVLVAGGLGVYRPMGVSLNGVDYLYLPSTTQKRMYLARVTSFIARPDFDRDTDVDQTDFGVLQACYSKPYAPISPGCHMADFDGDGDVDGDDVSVFRACMTGAGVAADAACVE